MSADAEPVWSPPSQAQIACANDMTKIVLDGVREGRSVHAETAVASAGRLAGTFLFRSFGFRARDVEPGTPVLSDEANRFGQRLIRTLGAGLDALGIELDQGRLGERTPPQNRPRVDLLTTQRRLEPACVRAAKEHGLGQVEAAHALALSAAAIIHSTRNVLDPVIAFGIAVYGFVEGSKSMPPELPKRGWRRWLGLR